jgi:hypothetical protein
MPLVQVSTEVTDFGLALWNCDSAAVMSQKGDNAQL